MNIGLLLLIIIGGSVGALSTLYIVVSLIGTIAYKISTHGKNQYKKGILEKSMSSPPFK